MRNMLAGIGLTLGVLAGASAETRDLAGWNLHYDAPEGFRAQQASGSVDLFASGTAYLLVSAGADREPKAGLADLGKLLSALQVAGALTEEPRFDKVSGLEAMIATGALQDRMGRRYQARFVVLSTPHGTSLRVLGLAPEGGSADAAVDAVAASVRAEAPAVDTQAVAALAGTWVLDQGNFDPGIGHGSVHGNGHEERITFDEQGRFEGESSSYVYVPDMPSDIDPTTSTKDAGEYTVIGRSLVLRGSTGTAVIDLEIRGGAVVAGGKRYHRQ